MSSSSAENIPIRACHLHAARLWWFPVKLWPEANPDPVTCALDRLRIRVSRTVDPAMMPRIAGQRQAVLPRLDQGRSSSFLTFHNTETTGHLQGCFGME